MYMFSENILRQEDNIMTVNRVKINYLSAVPKTSPVGRVSVSSSHMEELDKAIRQKVKQNKAERIASIEAAEQYTVRRKT